MLLSTFKDQLKEISSHIISFSGKSLNTLPDIYFFQVTLRNSMLIEIQ